MSALEILVTVIGVIVFIGGGWLFLQNRKVKKAVAADKAATRKPSPDKFKYDGVLLSDYKRVRLPDGTFREISVPDDGWVKGTVVGPRMAIVAAHSNPFKGLLVHSYDARGSKHVRTVIDYDDSMRPDDITVILLDEPFPPEVRAFSISRNVPTDLLVLHLDGIWSSRTTDKNSRTTRQLMCDYDRGAYDRALKQGESGLPWVSAGKLVSHTYRVENGFGPNYAVLFEEIMQVMERLLHRNS